MLSAALWACLQSASVEDLARRASVVGVAEIQSVSRDELRLRFTESWKGTSFGAFALEKPVNFLRSGERVVVFAGGVERGRHPVLALYRGEPLRREGDPFRRDVELPELKEKVFNALGKALPPEPPKKKPAPPPPPEPPPAPAPPPADPIDGLLPWGFGLAGILLAAGAAWLYFGSEARQARTSSSISSREQRSR